MERENSVTELHILVLGCMSSGKSTLLNALLGKDVFPTGNRATTAQIFQITHDFKCIKNLCRNPSQSVEWLELKKEYLTEWNGEMKENIPAEIYLKFPNLDKKRSIVFYDTPGPNTAKYEKHRKAAFFALEKLPLTHIFLVLDMAQLHTKDEEALLQDMQRAIQNRSEKIKVLAVLNKADLIDIDKESVAEILTEVYNTVHSRLPKDSELHVLPLMAKGAEIWRRMINKDELTSHEIEIGQYIDWRLCDSLVKEAIIPKKIAESILTQSNDWIHLQKFSGTFKSSLDYLAKRIHPEKGAFIKKDKVLDYADCKRAITASGIVALEEYIDSLTAC